MLGLSAWGMLLITLLGELLPLPRPLLAVAANQELSWSAFFLLSIGLVGAAIGARHLVAALQEQRRVAQELALLNECAQAIAQAELSVDDLCELIYEQASRVVDTSSFHLGLFEEDEVGPLRFALKVRVREGERLEPLMVTLTPGEGIVGWMRQSKRPLLVRDFQRELDQLPAHPSYSSERPPRSAVFVPLIAGQEVIGSLSVQHPRPRAFTPQHLRILRFIADQSALAIVKARLYQAAQERTEELGRIAQENALLYAQMREERDRLELLYDAARDLTRRLDLDDLLRRLLLQTVSSVQAEEGAIVLTGTRREPPRAISMDRSLGASPEEVLDRGLAGWVLQHRQGALLPDVDQDARWLPAEEPVGSAVAVPILHQDTAWGAITLTHSERGFFKPADMALLTAIAEQAAVALEAARLYEAQRRRAVQLQTIAQVMRRILAILDLDDLLDEVVHLVRERFGYTHAHIFTMDATGSELHFRASTDLDSSFWAARKGRLSLGEGLVGWVAQHEEPVIVDDVRQDARWLPDQADVISEVAVPLRVGEEIVGVLDVQSEELNAFDQEDRFILETLADQIAVALENARLYAAEQEEAWVQNALLQVAQNIARARQLDDLLEVVVRLVPLLVGVERCVIFLRDREEESFRAMHGYGGDWSALRDLPLTPGQVPPFGELLRQAGPVALFGPRKRQALPTALRQALGEGGMGFFPLIVGGEISGVLALGLGPEGTYLSSRQRAILTGITNQAGIAIEEARLRREAAERQRLEQELAVARDIQRRFLPEASPEIPGWSIQATWRSARHVGGDFYDFIRLPDGRLGVVIADVSDKGVPAALFMALSCSLMRASAISHFLPSEALKRLNRLLLPYSQAEMFVSVFYAIFDPRSGQVFYASAGHNPPLLCRPDGETLTLEARGIVLGVMEEIDLEEKSIRLEEGDLLCLYTDGVTETITPEREEFGLERLERFLCRHREKDLGEMEQALLEQLETFSQGQPAFDDVTMVLIRWEEG